MPKVSRIQVVFFSVFFLISSSLFAMGGVGVPFEVLRVASADTPAKKSLSWGVCSSYFTQEFRPNPGRNFMEHRTTISAGTGYMVADRFGIGVSSEFVRIVNDTSTGLTNRMNLEMKFATGNTSPLRFGLIFLSSIPIYTTCEGAESVGLVPKVVFTFDSSARPSLPPYRTHLNIGYSFTADGNKLDDLLLVGVGLELVAEEFTPFMEFTTEQAINDSSLTPKENPLRLTPGLKWKVSSAINFSFGLDLSISKPPLPGLKVVEDWKAVLSVSKY